ncbi:hypothetical protein J6590_015430 [Homalodisca vitripennis]|nr:hypothetical protein J6590_015430 [Homalodisca vitripennis]
MSPPMPSPVRSVNTVNKYPGGGGEGTEPATLMRRPLDQSTSQSRHNSSYILCGATVHAAHDLCAVDLRAASHERKTARYIGATSADLQPRPYRRERWDLHAHALALDHVDTSTAAPAQFHS